VPTAVSDERDKSTDERDKSTSVGTGAGGFLGPVKSVMHRDAVSSATRPVMA